jgi:type VI secretion system protein ImpJ
MSPYRKIVWNEGMLLTPQHFQQWDNYYEELLTSRLTSLVPYEWGVLDLQINHEALANGYVNLVRCRAVMPDGMIVNVPQGDAAPDARAVEGHFEAADERLEVYLSVPAKRAGAANFQTNGAASNQTVRYRQDAMTVPDETTGQNEQQLAFARSNLRLMFTDEVSEGYSAIKIAELERSTTGQLTLSETYVPPALTINASPWLANMHRQIVEMLIAKSSSLGEQRRQRTTSLADFTTSEIAIFWLLNTVNASIPGLAHLLRTRLVHPERLYMEMAELCGRLMTFSTDRHPKNVVDYRHTDLFYTFSQLNAEIRSLLETVIPTRCVQIPLESTRQSVYAGRVVDERLLADAEFFLGVSAKVSEGQLIELVPRVIKVASRDVIDGVIGAGLPGVKLFHASPPPAPIPTRIGFHYFSLEKSGIYWQAINDSKSVAVYVPDKLPDEKLELYAVKP